MVLIRDMIRRLVRLEVQLNYCKIIELVWVDIFGEIWEIEWQEKNEDDWNDFKEKIG